MGKVVNPETLKIHYLNEQLVPPMKPEELEALVLDVRERGVRIPIEVLAGTNLVIDGRNRLKAALQAELSNVPIEEIEISEDELPLYILSRVAVHRHLATSQKAALAAEYCELIREKVKIGRPTRDQHESTKNSVKIDRVFTGRDGARDLAAQRFGVANSYVQTALNLKKLSPESFQLLKAGDLSIKDAQAIVARAKVERVGDQLIPELKVLVELKRLQPEAAWHLAQLTTDEQKVLLEVFKKEGVSSLKPSEGQRIKLIFKNLRDTEEWKNLQEEMLDLREEKKKLEQQLQSARLAIEDYRDELDRLKTQMAEAAEEADSQLIARITYLETQVSNVKEEKAEIERKYREVEDQIDALYKQFIDERTRREAAEQELNKLKTSMKKIEEIVNRGARRGRKRKEAHQREIEQLRKKIEKLNQKIKEQQSVISELNKMSHMLSHRVIDLQARREGKLAQNDLKTVLGILKGPNMKRLPDLIALREGDVLASVEELNACADAMLELITEVLKAATILFEEIQVVEARKDVANPEKNQRA